MADTATQPSLSRFCTVGDSWPGVIFAAAARFLRSTLYLRPWRDARGEDVWTASRGPSCRAGGRTAEDLVAWMRGRVVRGAREVLT